MSPTSTGFAAVTRQGRSAAEHPGGEAGGVEGGESGGTIGRPAGREPSAAGAPLAPSSRVTCLPLASAHPEPRPSRAAVLHGEGRDANVTIHGRRAHDFNAAEQHHISRQRRSDYSTGFAHVTVSP